MKNWIKATLAVLVLVACIYSFGKRPGPEGTNGAYNLMLDVTIEKLKLPNLATATTSTHPMLFKDPVNGWVRQGGTLDSYLTPYALTSSLAGYVPTSRTLTINGTPFDLSANRAWTIPVNAYTAGTGLNLVGSTFNNTAPDQTVTLTAGNRIQITGTYPNFTIAYVEPTINQVSRNVNSNYTIGNRQATVYYSIPVTATNPLLAGTSVGTAFLEYSTNAGSSWTAALSTSSSSSVGLAVAIALTTGGSNLLSGVVPANALVRVRTITSGTATVGNFTGQEIY